MMQALQAAFLEQLGETFELDHKWACENDPEKQRFIREMFPELACIFPDVAGLVWQRARNIVSGAYEKVEATDVGFGGFPCTDISLENRHAKANRRVVHDGTKSTGAVFHAIAQFLGERPGLRFYFLENVMQLARPPLHKSALAAVAHELREVGRASKAFELSPTRFGYPQKRERVWIAVVHKSVFAECGVSENAFFEELSRIMAVFTNHAVTPLADLFLAEGHPIVQEMYAQLPEESTIAAELAANPPDLHAGKVGKLPVWLKDLQKLSETTECIQSLLQPPSPELSAVLPGLKALTLRQWVMLQLYTEDEALPWSKEVLVDVHKSWDRHNISQENVSMCIIPKAGLLHMKRLRKLHGLECMAIQNIYYQDTKKLARFDSTFLQDLAGNAFQTNCAAALTLATIVTYSTLKSRSNGVWPTIEPPPPPTLEPLEPPAEEVEAKASLLAGLGADDASATSSDASDAEVAAPAAPEAAAAPSGDAD